MTLQQLVYIIETVRYGSINKAAKMLHTSQPNISTAIMNLEQELNVTLFVRMKNGVVLTEEGEEFFAYAKAILNQFNDMKDVYVAKKNNAGSLNVSSNMLSYVSVALINFHRKYIRDTGRCSIHHREVMGRDVYRDLVEGVSTMGIMMMPKSSVESWGSFLSRHAIDWNFLFWSEEEILLRKDHPLLKMKKPTFEDLKKYPLIQGLINDVEAPNLNTEIEFLRYNEFPQIIYSSQRCSYYNFLQHTDAIFFAVTSLAVDIVYPGVASIPLSRFMPGITWGHFVLKLKKRSWSQEEEEFLETLHGMIESGIPKPARQWAG